MKKDEIPEGCLCIYGDFKLRDGSMNKSGRYILMECPVHGQLKKIGEGGDGKKVNK